MLLGVAGPRVALTTRVALGLALVGAAASPLAAQQQADNRAGPSWALNGLRTRQCVRFLIEPGAAARGLSSGYRLLRADQDSSLHPALRSVIAGQPEYNSWAPSALCFFYVDTLALGNVRVADKNMRKPQMVAVWTIATTLRGGARRDHVLELSSTSARIVRAAEAAKLRAREGEASVSKARESTAEVYQVKLGKTRLTWTGRAAGDSTRVDEPLVESWLVKGASGVIWNVRATLNPVWTRALVGVLRVEGKDDLAKALKASPIRFVGPRYQGGEASFVFSR